MPVSGYPYAFGSGRTQTQTLIVGADPGDGPAIDLGADVVGVVGLVTATIKDVNLDGGSWAASHLRTSVVGSFDGSNWDGNATSGSYAVAAWPVATFKAADPAPLYAQFLISRYLKFQWEWQGNGGSPPDIGPNASATLTFVLDYF